MFGGNVPGYRFSLLPTRIIMANGIVVDLVGTVHLELRQSELWGDETIIGCSKGVLDVRMSATDFQLYLPGEQAPEHNSKLRALPSGADRLPLERVDGEILPED